MTSPFPLGTELGRSLEDLSRTRPIFDRRATLHHVHAGILEVLEGLFRHIREVQGLAGSERVGNVDRRSAIAHDIHLAGELRILSHDVLQEVRDGLLHTVTRRQPSNDDHVRVEQALDQASVFLDTRNRLTREERHHFRLEDGVALGERVAALDLRGVGGAASEGVEETKLVNRAHQLVPLTTQHTVVGPEEKLVFGLPGYGIRFFQLTTVVGELARQPGRIDTELRRHGRIGHEFAVTVFVRGDKDPRIRMTAVFAKVRRGVEDLEGQVGIHRRNDFRDDPHVLVTPIHQVGVRVGRPGAGATTDIQRPLRETEVGLIVDRQDTNPDLVGANRLEAVRLTPGFRTDLQRIDIGLVQGICGICGRKMRRQRQDFHV